MRIRFPHVRRLAVALVLLSAIPVAQTAEVTMTTEGVEPHSIRSHFGADAATEMTIVWGSASASSQEAQYGVGGAFTHTASSVVHEFPDYMYWNPGGLVSPPGWYTFPAAHFVHVVRLSGLTPNAAYSYRVGLTGVWSDPHTFHTSPAAGDTVTFTAYGDTAPALKSDDTPRWSHSAQNAANASRHGPAFHLHLGDISYADSGKEYHEPWWKQWFEEQAPLTGIAPYMPAIGNHDWRYTNDSTYYHGKIWPVTSDWRQPGYSFRYGDVAVVVSFVDDEDEPPLLGADWLAAELAKHADARWKVVTMHAPLYSTNRHGSACPTREVYEPVLDAAGVDIVLAGHDHAYERTFAIEAGVVQPAIAPNVYAKGSGTTHVTAGSGGPSGLYDFSRPLEPCDADASYSAARALEYAHVVVTAGPEEMRVQAFSWDRRPLDDVRIVG